jgi:hypothetical protein
LADEVGEIVCCFTNSDAVPYSRCKVTSLLSLPAAAGTGIAVVVVFAAAVTAVVVVTRESARNLEVRVVGGLQRCRGINPRWR